MNSFPTDAEIVAALPWGTILTHCLIDLTAEELEQSGDAALLTLYRNTAIETAMDYQGAAFTLDSNKARQAILLMIGDMWRNREDEVSPKGMRAAYALLHFGRVGIL